MAQILVQGLATAMIYSLIGLGFVLIYRTVGLFNFGHPESYTLGALTSYTLVTQLRLPYWLSIGLAAILAFLSE
ncbi:MAG TPA: hypothetical protein PLJ35_07160 [Anaerolineae bacterium]|nr:hypothetical protein [Anaerolineae bacterium]